MLVSNVVRKKEPLIMSAQNISTAIDFIGESQHGTTGKGNEAGRTKKASNGSGQFRKMIRPYHVEPRAAFKLATHLSCIAR
jgi:hypothetical protein